MGYGYTMNLNRMPVAQYRIPAAEHRIPVAGHRMIVNMIKDQKPFLWFYVHNSQTQRKNGGWSTSFHTDEHLEAEAASDSIHSSIPAKLCPCRVRCTCSSLHFEIANRIIPLYFNFANLKYYLYFKFANRKIDCESSAQVLMLKQIVWEHMEEDAVTSNHYFSIHIPPFTEKCTHLGTQKGRLMCIFFPTSLYIGEISGYSGYAMPSKKNYLV